MHSRLLPAVAVLCLAASPVAAQTTRLTDLADLGLEELLKVEVVSTASKFAQPVTDAPSSISVITAEEIRRFGHRTLADVLRSVRGLYTTYDRNYAYVGVRGFSRPGDYNTRVLLLIDGHRVNDPVYDMAPIGTDFPLDLSLVERVEVVRGPGSSLYGTNALLAVVNVVTREPSDLHGVQLSGGIASQTTGTGTVNAGGTIGDVDVAVSASGYGSRGMSSIYFPEYAGTLDGIARRVDGDDTARVFASATIGRLALRASHSSREKAFPTGAFGVIFGDRRATTEDERTFVDASYRAALGGWTGVARAAADRYDYAGHYPFDYGESLGSRVWEDGATTSSVTGELTLNRRLRRHFVTLGTEARRFLTANQMAEDGVNPSLDDRRRSTLLGVYAQDEFTLVPSRLALTLGIRVDRHEAYGTQATPRAGLVYRPSTRTSLKLLHGRSFRAANYYERFYHTANVDVSLAPEQITSTEGVWEQYIGKHLRTSFSVYNANFRDLITQQASPLAATDPNLQDELVYVNLERSRSVGFEAEVEGRWPSGVTMRATNTISRAEDRWTGARLSNSPSHLSTVNVTVPVPSTRRSVYVAAEGQYVGARLAVRGAGVDGYYVQNLHLTLDRIGRVDLGIGVRNLFNASYADPGAEEHLQQVIPQDRRTMSFTARLRF